MKNKNFNNLRDTINNFDKSVEYSVEYYNKLRDAMFPFEFSYSSIKLIVFQYKTLSMRCQLIEY